MLVSIEEGLETLEILLVFPEYLLRSVEVLFVGRGHSRLRKFPFIATNTIYDLQRLRIESLKMRLPLRFVQTCLRIEFKFLTNRPAAPEECILLLHKCLQLFSLSGTGLHPFPGLLEIIG